MEDRVPGGRQRSLTVEDFSMDDEEDVSLPTTTTTSPPRLNSQHRQHASQSLPKSFTNETRRADSLPDDSRRAQTLDRKKKRSQSFKASFGSLMHKMVRQVSSISLHGNAPKTTKRRSQSVGPGDGRSRRGSLRLQNSVDSALSDGAGTPTTPIKSDRGWVPGILGIRNHGNTCFMNAVLQCLCHTELLAEYFVTDQYRSDIRRNNKINAKKFGTRGELTDQLAILLKSLWSGQYTAEISNDFKTVVGKYGSQYRGFAQHDAQEFLLWLLDKVHEDLNIATKKKYRANKSSYGRSDEQVAAEALANHMRCNNSFVYDLFQALYRSSLTCPNCRRQSNTFDPFLSVSLPIPQKTQRPVYVTVSYLDAQPKQVKIGLLLNQCDTVRELRQTLASDTKIPESQLILTEIDAEGFHRTFHDNQPLTDIQETDSVYAIETPAPLVETGPNAQYLTSRYLIILLLNKHGMGSQGRRFGAPLVLQVLRDTTFLDLQRDLLHNMVGMLREGIIAQKMGVLFRLRVVDGLPGKCYLPTDVEHPLYMPTVDRALAAHPNNSGPQHLKLLVEWDPQTKQCMIASSDDVVEEHASVQQVRLAHQQPVLGTLDECFRLYTQEEKLGGDNAWLCPACRRRQTGTIKTLSLWSLPDILVIHLKRFRQVGERRTKLNTLITFPVHGLDMSQHAARRSSSHHSQSSFTWSPWRRNKQSPATPDENVYDLYAVCNHYGNMQGGHYTAFCRNPSDGNWYVYDDTQVKPTSEDQIVTRAAYLLFYCRRPLHSPNRAVTWIYNIMAVHYRPRPPVSKSHEDLLEEPGVEEEAEAADNAEVEAEAEASVQASRDVPSYATMRTPVKSRSHGALASTHSLEPVHTANSMGTIHGDTDRKPPSGTLHKQVSAGSDMSSASVPVPSSTPKDGVASSPVVTGVYRGTISSSQTPNSGASTPNGHTTRSILGTPTRALTRSDTVGSGVGLKSSSSSPHSTVGVEASEGSQPTTTGATTDKATAAGGARDSSTWPYTGPYYMKESCV